ncbi:Glycosidase [Hahella chejuensis KCTC 2396]|uniref:Alpha-amylase n=1 Tax=Hahella chejuensis (strain KCTC 2396) TaxID=349521 RepID=Q2SER3_HAHCH|nr:carbohydrate-binding module family 20 domain-containing protein [Hahella chejuensis]ABC30861.1 Glycosidase [Hahella chejuensis KCTC 2396]
MVMDNVNNKNGDNRLGEGMKRFIFASVCAGALCAAGNGYGEVNRHASVMVHLFEWSWEDIAQECEQYLGPKGFTAVQVSPPQAHIGGAQWWTRYQPVSYVLNSRSGDRERFQNMTQRCAAAGVDVYADLVINHMASTGFDFPDVPYGVNDFHNWNCGGINYGDANQVWNCDLVGLKDLKTESDYVRGKIADYINDLMRLGVKGFRIDAAKHMPPADIENIVGRVQGSPYIFQEVIRASGEAVQPEMYTHIADVTEFQMERDLAWHFRNGRMANLIDFSQWDGRVASSDAMVFVANHDDQRQHPEWALTWNDPQGMYYLAHIFMLAYPYGYPRVMSSYYFNNHDQGPPNSGPHTAGACGVDWVCEHRWGGIGNMAKFRQATAANAYISNVSRDGDNRLAFGRGGLGFVALNNDTGAWSASLDTGLPAGEYCDILHGDYVKGVCTGPTVFVDSAGYASVNVAGRDAMAMHVEARVADCPQCQSQRVDVSFTCDNGQTQWGQSVYAVGDLPELGGWSPAGAVKLEPTAYPVWSGVISVPMGTQIEWKCLKRDENNPGAGIEWQPGSNTVFNSDLINATRGGW